MTDRENYGVFILTHGRPDKVVTHRSLRRHGYTGPIVVLVDDEDEAVPRYRECYGDEVTVFSKAEVARRIDVGDRRPERTAIIYARHAAFDIARERGWDYLVQLDDDYSTFIYRPQAAGHSSRFGVSYGSEPIVQFDKVWRLLIDLLEDTGALTVAMSQGGDHMGGAQSSTLRAGYKRKAMNSFVLRTDRPIAFTGRMNEDVSAYCLGGSRGELFLTVTQLQLQQLATQSLAGGMTAAYRDGGTYLKSFYTVMQCPAFVRIREMGRTDRRWHHSISWNNAVPKILSPDVRRA